MDIITGRIGSKEKVDFEAKLQNASEAIVATCYFRPGPRMMECLKRIPRLKLIYSREYKVTNPESLRELTSTGAEVRYVTIDDPDGRMHAKVYYFVLKDGSKSCFVGSANLTHYGLFRNQEAGVLFDSEGRDDAIRIGKIRAWLTSLWRKHEQNTFTESEYEHARRQHKESRLKLRSDEIHPWKTNTASEWGKNWRTIRYWVLKTTDAETGDDHWQRFLDEGVIAIGWELFSGRARKFREFDIGDIVLVCDGYWPNTKDERPIRIRGAARVIGEECQDAGSDWWIDGGRREARIQVVDRTLEKGIIGECLSRGSLTMAVHRIARPDDFESLAITLYEEYGTIIDV